MQRDSHLSFTLTSQRSPRVAFQILNVVGVHRKLGKDFLDVHDERQIPFKGIRTWSLFPILYLDVLLRVLPARPGG